MIEHPLQRFWVEQSRWHSREHPTPELALGEGRLCIDTWNAAVKAAWELACSLGDSADARERILALLYYPEQHE